MYIVHCTVYNVYILYIIYTSLWCPLRPSVGTGRMRPVAIWRRSYRTLQVQTSQGYIRNNHKVGHAECLVFKCIFSVQKKLYLWNMLIYLICYPLNLLYIYILTWGYPGKLPCKNIWPVCPTFIIAWPYGVLWMHRLKLWYL